MSKATTDPDPVPDDTVTLHGVDGIVTKTVNESGVIYLGRDLSGQDVKVAFRVESESDDRDPEDTEN